MKRSLVALLLAVALIFPVSAFPAAYLMPPPKAQFFDNNGNPCASCRIWAYDSGTTTLKNTYTSSAMTVANTNPIVLNSRGEPTYGIWLSGEYSIKLTTAAGTTIWTVPNVVGIQDLSAIDISSRWQASYAPTYVSTTSFSVAGDRRSDFPVGRRVQIIGSSTVYGRITAVAYVTVTTVTVALDSGIIDTGISTVNVSLETPTNSSISADMITSGTTSANFITSGTIISSGTNTWGGTQNITGAATFSGTTTMTGTQNFSGTTAMTGTQNFSGTTAMTGTLTLSPISSGTHTINGSTIFNATAGTAPFSIPTSTTVVTNLNADLLDGSHASTTPYANEIPILDGSGNLIMGDADGTGGNIYLKNESAISGQLSDNTTNRSLIGVGVDDKIYVGHASQPTRILGSTVDINGYTAWHSGNDGAGSGLAADTAISATNATNATQWNERSVMTGSVTWDAPAIGAGASQSTTATVSGATVGDWVLVQHANWGDGVLLVLDGRVSATNTVTIRLTNFSAGNIDLGNTTYTILVIH